MESMAMLEILPQLTLLGSGSVDYAGNRYLPKPSFAVGMPSVDNDIRFAGWDCFVLKTRD